MRSLKRLSFVPLMIVSGLGRGSVCADDITLIPNATLQVAGGRLTGRIESETPTSVRIVPDSGSVRDVPIEQIARINYTGQPPSLPLAEASERSGNFQDALDKFTQAAEEARGKPLIVQRAQYGQAHALMELAMVDPSRAQEAQASLDSFIQANPTSRHLGPALEHVARLAFNQGDLTRAADALSRLKKIPWAAERAAILETKVQSKRGQSDQALVTLESIIARAQQGSNLAVQARLSRADVLAAAGRYDEAAAAAQEVIDNAGPEAAELQAEAYNTLGDCLRAAGRTKDALYAYLHTDILYDVNKEEHARALAQIEEIWRELNRPDRADEVRGRLQSLYPNSPLLNQTP